ncbi:MAG: hypothetical protein GF334_06545 [Candidatus Altiarchaeales archaeon]|nr:hypothetical protein [Candidatus Altiarchaeales archaeon]
MDWKGEYRVVKDTETALVMQTSSGRVHVVAVGSRHTLCRKPFSTYDKRYGFYRQGIKKTTFRPLTASDMENLCPACHDRLQKSDYVFPWSESNQTISRLEGMGILSAKAHGEDRVSVTVNEMDALISMIRRG